MIKRAAVFGGAGFIGINLVYELIGQGCRVFNFDNLTGLGNLLNIEDLMNEPNHRFVRCDITKEEDVRKALLVSAPDTIFLCLNPRKHCPKTEVCPFETFFSTLENWRKNVGESSALQKIVVVMYEHHTVVGNFDELYQKVGALVKRFAENGLPITSVIAPQVFGPYQHPDSPIPIFIYRAIEGETIPVVNPEGSFGETIHVSELIRAALLIGEKGHVGNNYLLAGRKPYLKNNEITDAICDELNRQLPPPIGKYQALIEEFKAPESGKTDIHKDSALLYALGFSDSKDLHTSLSETVHWYLTHSNWYNQSKTRFFDLWQNPKKILRLE